MIEHILILREIYFSMTWGNFKAGEKTTRFSGKNIIRKRHHPEKTTSGKDIIRKRQFSERILTDKLQKTADVILVIQRLRLGAGIDRNSSKGCKLSLKN